MRTNSESHSTLAEIPSSTRRLWLGLVVILLTFGFFATYTVRKIRRLESFQLNVVEHNRRSSLQLLRLENDSYELALSIRDMELARSSQPLGDWKPEFTRLLTDMADGARLEAQFAVASPPGDALRERLQADLDGLGRMADRVFTLAAQGKAVQARALVTDRLDLERADLTAVVVRLLRMNSHAQIEASEKISGVYGAAKTDVLEATGLLFLLAIATGLYVVQANRRTFERLRHLAEQLNTQSHQLRELSWRLIDVQEQTLRHVSRDLHDQFGQILTAVGLVLNRADRHGASAEARRELENARAIVQETLQNVRDQSQMFRPAILDDFGLNQAIEWFTRQFAEQTHMAVHFSANSEDGRFAPAEAIHLYRIVQEALNNIARHAKATEAWVTLEERGDALEIRVRDNGSGFQVGRENGSPPKEGLGLLSMRERAEHLSGTLTIESQPGHGTTIIARLPIRAAVQKTHVADSTRDS